MHLALGVHLFLCTEKCERSDSVRKSPTRCDLFAHKNHHSFIFFFKLFANYKIMCTFVSSLGVIAKMNFLELLLQTF